MRAEERPHFHHEAQLSVVHIKVPVLGPFSKYPSVMICLVALTIASLGSLASAITVTVPLAAPTAAPVISQSLFSLSIEQDRWTDWVGTTARNTFFFNTLDNLAGLAGQPPHIRIGADSEVVTSIHALAYVSLKHRDTQDHTNFNPNIQVCRTRHRRPATCNPLCLRQFAQDVFPAPTTTVPYPEASTVVVGDGFYQAVQFLPSSMSFRLFRIQSMLKCTA